MAYRYRCDVGKETNDREFLWRSIGYLHSRAELIDNKANMSLALLTAAVVALTAGLTAHDVNGLFPFLAVTVAYVAIGGGFLLWLMVIRPKFWRSQPSDSAMWLSPNRWREPLSLVDHRDLLRGDGPDDALLASHRALLSTLSRKMGWYQLAMAYTKVLALGLVAVVAVFVLK